MPSWQTMALNYQVKKFSGAGQRSRLRVRREKRYAYTSPKGISLDPVHHVSSIATAGGDGVVGIDVGNLLEMLHTID